MARNGSGTYSLPSGNPVVTGTTISSTTHNNTLTDIATALTGSLAKNGETTATGNQPMGGFKHTAVGDTSARTDYAKASQVQDGAFTYLTSVSGTDTITATGAFSLAAYAAGQIFHFVAAGTNTGAATLDINSIAAKAIQFNGAALAAGDIVSGGAYSVVYDGTQFQLSQATRGVPAMVLLASDAATAQTSIDFNSLLTSTYSSYILDFHNFLPATDSANLFVRLSTNNGSSFISTAASYAWAVSGYLAGTGATGGASNGDTEIQLNITGMSFTAGQEAAGRITIHAPTEATSSTIITGELAHYNAASQYVSGVFGGQRVNDEDNDSFQLIMSSGNIATINYSLYGVL